MKPRNRLTRPARAVTRALLALAMAGGLLATVGADPASASIHSIISFPSNNSNFTWQSNSSGGGVCSQQGANNELYSCVVILEHPVGTTYGTPLIVYRQDGSDAVGWSYPLPCLSGEFRFVAHATSSSGNQQTDRARFTMGIPGAGCPGGGGDPDPPVNQAPSATISTPSNGSSYLLGQVVDADYGCSDPEGNLSGCSGPVATGTPIDTSSTGGKSFDVTATDTAGLTGSASTSYTVYEPPSPSVGGPADGTVFTPGQQPTPMFSASCNGGVPGGSGTFSVQQPDGSTVGIQSGDPLPSGQPGTYTITISCTDGGGNTSSTTVTYRVNAPPTAVITTPPDGASYFVNDQVGADSGCFDSDGTIDSYVKSAGPNGTLLYTGHSGTYTSTVTATDDDGATTSVTHTYKVINRPPTATITSPPVPSLGPDGLSFYLDEEIPASYSCADLDNNLKAPPAGCVGTYPNGGHVDTSTTGAKNLHVVATDAEDATGTADQGYNVYRRPEAAISSPSNGKVFTPGQDPTPTFHGGCQFGIPNLSCTRLVRHWAGTPVAIADGDPVPTAPYGEYTLQVTATDARPTTDQEITTVRANRPPVATVTSTPSSPTTFATGPQAAKRYFVDQTVYASYSCADTKDTPYIDVSIVSCLGTVPNGAKIDTTTVGNHTFTVTAIDNDGGKHVLNVPYAVHPVVGPCRATALDAAGLKPGQANGATNPCVTATKADLATGVAPLVGAGLLTGSTTKGIGFHAATTTVAGLKLNVAGLQIGVDALTASARSQIYDCDESSIVTWVNQIGRITVGGVPLKVELKGTLNLLVLSLRLGEVQQLPGQTVLTRPIYLDLPGALPDITIAEVIAGASCGPLPLAP